ncbi:hypothetical protein AB4672_21600 [Bacillus paralicheniformis]|uniref:hypothetical protein n=1 Tax=Bacillus paralicheniformis TaxID=1648923 RepID=UPI0034D2123D
MLKAKTNTSINEKISIITEIKKGLDEVLEKVSLVKHTRLTATWAKVFDENGNMISPTVEEVKEAFREDPSSFRMY